MTEAEWLTTKLPLYMLSEYPAAWDGRKVRLFWCACVRRSWERLTDARARRFAEAVEKNPEDAGARVASELAALNEDLAVAAHPDSWAIHTFHNPPPGSLMGLVEALAHGAAVDAALAAGVPPYSIVGVRAEIAEKEWQCDLLREVFGNPFRPVKADPAWLTSDVLALARGIYEEKAFDRMPILADALQDAGCDNADVLDHCRQPGEHVRGCWVIDTLLGTG